jgi:hypothetical protein
MFDSEPIMPTTVIAFESPIPSIGSVFVMASPPHPTNPNSIVFIVPNMNHSLHIKLSKGNFMAWRTQIIAYIKGQDAFGFLDGSSQPPRRFFQIPALLLVLRPPWSIQNTLHGVKWIK